MTWVKQSVINHSHGACCGHVCVSKNIMCVRDNSFFTALAEGPLHFLHVERKYRQLTMYVCACVWIVDYDAKCSLRMLPSAGSWVSAQKCSVWAQRLQLSEAGSVSTGHWPQQVRVSARILPKTGQEMETRLGSLALISIWPHHHILGSNYSTQYINKL